MNKNSPFRLKRIYDSPLDSDGKRILVDRLWPRGMSKERAQIDWWAKELAPSHELRRSYDHSPQMWHQFKAGYFAELDDNSESVENILQIAMSGPVTLLYASGDKIHNNALALKEYLDQKLMER